MQHPFQCLACIGDKYLIAASGPQIVTQPLDSTGKTSIWTSETDRVTMPSEKTANEDGERPAKKQKTTAKTTSKAPDIIKLTVSPDQKHVIAVTDDKFVRVFEQDDGALTELSQRAMPKRPCAIQVLPDNATILVGDKFGDVYSLPLMQESTENGQTPESAQPEKAFKPSATTLTVHSQRNLKALEAQKKQKNFMPRKEPLKFKHSLLLGHVSMLTDMKYLVHQNEGSRRDYILTADRDEHIRISRGPPQAHIIEGFCLGHTQFISKICQVGVSNLLVSGGGDDWLGVWDWVNGKLIKKIDLMTRVRQVLDPAPTDYHLAVSGIWSVGVAQDQVVVVACEGVKALFIISNSSLKDDSDASSGLSIVKLGQNPLDVTAIGDHIIVSMDARKEGDARLAAYTVATDDSGAAVASRVEAKETEQLSWLTTLNGCAGPEQEMTDKELENLLYGVAQLRKRGPLAEDDGGDDNEAAEDE